MSMVEVVVAALLLGMMAVIGTTALVQGQAATVANRSRVVAASLAARELDFVRQRLAVSPAAAEAVAGEGVVTNAHPLDPDLPAGDPAGYVVDGMTYTVDRRAGLRTLGATSACEGGSTYATKRATEVEVTVTWEAMGTAAPYVLRQVFAPHKDVAPDTEDALVAVAVRDERNRPVAGVTARVAAADGSQVETATTDAAGCAVAAVGAAPSGSQYAVTLVTTGYVDPSGNSTPAQTLHGVVPTQISRASFAYARAGTLTVHLGGAATSSSLITVVRPDGELVVVSPDAGSGGTRVTITDAYPGQWGAYPGTGAVPPGADYRTVALAAGGQASISLVVP